MITKKLYIRIVTTILMMIMVFLIHHEDMFSSPIFKQYVFQKEGFAISFPEQWKYRKLPYSGEEVLFTLIYETDQPMIGGMVQIWNISDLKGFLEQSIQIAPSIDNIRLEATVVGHLKGYLLSYRQHVTEERKFIMEYFLQGESKRVYRLALIQPETLYDERYIALFEQVVASLKLLPSKS